MKSGFEEFKERIKKGYLANQNRTPTEAEQFVEEALVHDGPPHMPSHMLYEGHLVFCDGSFVVMSQGEVKYVGVLPETLARY